MTSPDATLRMILQYGQPGSRIGTVTTGGAAPVVTLDGAGSITVGYLADGLVLAAGDRALVVRAAGGVWVAAAKLTTPAAPVSPITKAIAPTTTWRKVSNMAGSWGTQITENPPTIYQGQDYFNAGAGGEGFTAPLTPNQNATVLVWGSLSALVPSGSTILDVSLAFTRNEATSTPPLVYPRLYGNLYSPSSPPNAATAPVAVSGFGPLAGVAAVGRGQSTTIGLPASWVTAWVAGTITGLHLYSAAREDALFSYRDDPIPDDVVLLVTYQPPPE